MLNNTTKGILSVIGGILLHGLSGSVFTFAAINAYYASYLKEANPTLKVMDLFFVMPIALLFFNIFSTPGAILNDIVGPRMTSFFGIGLILVSHAILIVFKDFSIMMAGIVVFGIGIGIAYIPVMKNAWKYFPDKAGLCSGLILSGFGLGSFFFNTLSDAIINPFKKIPGADGFYSRDVADNLLIYLKTNFMIYACVGVVIILLVCPFPEQQVEEKEDKILPHVVKEPLDQALFSFPMLKLTVMMVCTLFFALMLGNTSRTFGNLNKIDQSTLQIMSKLWALGNAFGRIFWGALFDIYGFKTIYFIILINQFYVLAVVMSVLTLAGHMSTMPGCFKKVFGVKNGAYLYGIGGMCSGIGGLISPILARSILHDITDYLILYSLGTALSVISLCSLLTFTEQPFKYEERQEVRSEEEIKILLAQAKESESSKKLTPERNNFENPSDTSVSKSDQAKKDQ